MRTSSWWRRQQRLISTKLCENALIFFSSTLSAGTTTTPELPRRAQGHMQHWNRVSIPSCFLAGRRINTYIMNLSKPGSTMHTNLTLRHARLVNKSQRPPSNFKMKPARSVMPQRHRRWKQRLKSTARSCVMARRPTLKRILTLEIKKSNHKIHLDSKMRTKTYNTDWIVPLKSYLRR